MRTAQTKRLRLDIAGIVQGVGFRPFVYRLAREHGLAGWVRNTASGVELEIEGPPAEVASFRCRLESEAPPLALITGISGRDAAPLREREFRILASAGGETSAQIAPDGDVCADCLREMFDPSDRRFRYPFINCTNCGPRYTIITGIPYDRPMTTMAGFPLCPACRAEYEDPADRRFHAQPVACPVCGPRLELVDRHGERLEGDPLETAIAMLKAGRILAIKGIGGYHLAVDAGNDAALRELRRRKQRDEKPFALMVPGLEQCEALVMMEKRERRLLTAPERPIVIMPRLADAPVSPLVAPANGYLGVMLPSSPLHHLLLRDNFTALVMTSGNLTDEPIAFREAGAMAHLAGIADLFLTHNREIHTRTDDSVIRVFRGEPLFLRRSRGYAPRGIILPAIQPPVLAVGAELKSAICLTRDDTAFMSQHIGDLKNAATLESMGEIVGHLQRTLEIRPTVIAHDLHPDYLSTAFAQESKGAQLLPVQHHHAHMAACMAENRLEGEVIGIIFDGAGYGDDGTVWGGEFLSGGYAGYRRHGHIHQVRLPGGDSASREPWRMAISWLHAALGDQLFETELPFLRDVPQDQRRLLLQMLHKGVNSPLTSSCGRLFDAVAAIIGLRNQSSYEGQAAMELEALAEGDATAGHYPFAIFRRNGLASVDPRMTIAAIAGDVARAHPAATIARRFHNTLAEMAVAVCVQIRQETGLNRVVLSGGVFQNRLLSEGVASLLEQRDFSVFTHRLVPPNDGGIALGQAIIAGRSRLCA